MSRRTLEDALTALSPSLASVLRALASACVEISRAARLQGACMPSNSTNLFGDEQLALDLAAESIIQRKLRACTQVATISSEESPVETHLSHQNAHLSVAYDPLDGSSIVRANWAVGSIFGVWKGRRLTGVRGEDMCASMLSVYGPRTTLFLAADGVSGVTEYTLITDDDGNEIWAETSVVTALDAGKRVFSPANLRAAAELDGYSKLVMYYMQQKYTLRYSGGLVPDVTQIIVRKSGIFTSPVAPHAPPKLRLLYEALPVAYMIVRVGGHASDGNTELPLMQRTVSSCDERTALIVGECKEVCRFEEFCCATRNANDDATGIDVRVKE